MALREDVVRYAPPPRSARRRAWPQVVALLAVLALALAVGGGLGKGTTDAARVAALEADVRCPACVDVSVADSEAPSAVAVRRQIAAMVARGRSDGQIESSLVARYGPTILLRPPTSGVDLLVWLVPLVAGLGAAAGLVVLFVQRSRALGYLKDDAP